MKLLTLEVGESHSKIFVWGRRSITVCMHHNIMIHILPSSLSLSLAKLPIAYSTASGLGGVNYSEYKECGASVCLRSSTTMYPWT